MPDDLQLDILYDNGPCLVVNKPPGLLTQAPAGIDSLEVRVKAFYKEREQKEGNIYLGLPHPLDPPVPPSAWPRSLRTAPCRRCTGRLLKATSSRTKARGSITCTNGTAWPRQS